MPIDKINKVVFIHIPKTGGQSVSKMLGMKRTKSYWYTNGDNYTHATISQIKQKLDVSYYYIFTFIRDPAERILSEYNHRMRNIAAPHLPVSNTCTFTDYAEHLYRSYKAGWKRIDQHLKAHVIPQSDYIDESVNLYRYDDFESECERLRQTLKVNRPTPRVNYFADDKPAHTIRTLDIVHEIYEKDIILHRSL